MIVSSILRKTEMRVGHITFQILPGPTQGGGELELVIRLLRALAIPHTCGKCVPSRLESAGEQAVAIQRVPPLGGVTTFTIGVAMDIPAFLVVEKAVKRPFAGIFVPEND